MTFIIDHGYIATDIEFKKILLSVSIKCLLMHSSYMYFFLDILKKNNNNCVKKM